jgi:thioredoxin-like negative regulator of GroEL
MNQALKPVWGLFFILLAVTAVSLLMKATRPKEIVPWRSDYGTALQESRASEKPAFVYFTATWCGPCQTMKHTTWADKEVEAALRAFVPVKVDLDHQPDVARQFAVEAIPAYVVLDPAGAPVAAWDGAMPPALLLSKLKDLSQTSSTRPNP